MCRVRGRNNNLSSRLVAALPERFGIKRHQCLGLEVLVPLWRYTAGKRAVTHSRLPPTARYPIGSASTSPRRNCP
jgi:hypothetical protein